MVTLDISMHQLNSCKHFVCERVLIRVFQVICHSEVLFWTQLFLFRDEINNSVKHIDSLTG